MSGQAVTKAFIPLPAGATAVYLGSTLSYCRHPDLLGRSRFASTPGRTMYYSGAYAPFGAEAGTADRSFTGQNQDTVPGSTTGLYDFLFREYAQYGRWISPDPAGMAAVNPANPQSWNRYAYVLNAPTGLIDPLGLDTCLADLHGTREDGYWLVPWFCGSWIRFFYLTVALYDDAHPKPHGRPVNKSWSKTFPCGQNATQLMATVESDLSRFANYSGTLATAVFSPGAVVINQTLLIDTQTKGIGGLSYGRTNAVKVSSVTPNSFTFTTVEGQHFFYPGTVSFSAADAGNGQVQFSISVNGTWADILSQAQSPAILSGENSAWNSLLDNLQSFCQSTMVGRD